MRGNGPEWTRMDRRDGPKWYRNETAKSEMNQNEGECTGMNRNEAEWTGITQECTGMSRNEIRIEPVKVKLKQNEIT